MDVVNDKTDVRNSPHAQRLCGAIEALFVSAGKVIEQLTIIGVECGRSEDEIPAISVCFSNEVGHLFRLIVDQEGVTASLDALGDPTLLIRLSGEDEK